MDVLFISKADYSNVGYLFSKALQAVGMEAEAWAIRPSPRVYAEHALIFKDIEQLRGHIKKAKAITFMHSQWFDRVDYSGKPLYVFHGGSRYRMQPQRHNEIFNGMVEKSIIQTGDLLDLGAVNQVWILPCVDIDTLNRMTLRLDWHDSRYVFCHYPHKSYVKGTEGIHTVLSKLRTEKAPCVNENGWEFYINDQIVPWQDNLARIVGCDIYVEACKPFLGTQPYGEWGLSALEAAALGKIVVTHFRSYDRYLKEYGECPLQVANDVEEFESVVRKLLLMKRNEINDLKHAHLEWAKKFHSFEAVGKRLMEKVYDKI